jgi:hypothetical protein
MRTITCTVTAIAVTAAVAAALAGRQAVAGPSSAAPAARPWNAFCSEFITQQDLNQWFADRGAEGWEPMNGAMTWTNTGRRLLGCVRRQLP